MLVTVTSCSRVFYNPIPTKLDDSGYKKPQTLSAKNQTPQEAISPLDKQIKFVTPTNENQSKSKRKRSQSVSQTETQPSQSYDKNLAEAAIVDQAVVSVVEEPEYEQIDDISDPSSRQAEIVTAMRDNQHPSKTSYDPFKNGKLVVDLSQASQNFVYPINGKYSSGYGSRGRGWHSGVDLTAPSGTPIYAAFDGRVRMSKPYGGYGNMIVLQHENGLETVYGHCLKTLVEEGQMVKSGEKIALCGRTGRATGTHLHFEVRVAGSTINPALLVNYTLKAIQPGTIIVTKNGSRISASRSTSSETIENNEKPLPPKKEDVALASAAAVANPDNEKPKTSASAPLKATSHTIVKGDTLYAIAKKYGTTVDNLCTLNNISKTIILKLGVKLRIK